MCQRWLPIRNRAYSGFTSGSSETLSKPSSPSVRVLPSAPRFDAPIRRGWDALGYLPQIAWVLVATACVWAFTLRLGGPDGAAAPLEILGYTGFLLGIVVAFPLEQRFVGFAPRRAPLWQAAIRLAIAAALVLATLAGLDAAFAALAPDDSVPGYALRFLRYALAGAVGLLAAPALFVRTGLGECGPPADELPS